jgi:hypothetical protein
MHFMHVSYVFRGVATEFGENRSFASFHANNSKVADGVLIEKDVDEVDELGCSTLDTAGSVQGGCEANEADITQVVADGRSSSFMAFDRSKQTITWRIYRKRTMGQP